MRQCTETDMFSRPGTDALIDLNIIYTYKLRKALYPDFLDTGCLKEIFPRANKS